MSSPSRTTSEDPKISQATDPDPPLTAQADSAEKAGSAAKGQEPPGSGTASSSAVAAALAAAPAAAPSSVLQSGGGSGRRRSGFAVGGDGTTLFYEVLGRPQPATSILLCDGLGCDGYVWKYLQWVLAQHYRILHFHYRGHGRTPLPADISRVSIADFATDALTVLDACETERVVLCGHSLGVQVALETWRAAPARVAGLILICGSYGNPLQTFKGKDTLSELLPLLRATVSRLPRLVGAFWKRLIPTELSYLLAQKLEINGALVQREDFFPYLEAMSRLDPRMFVSTLAAAGQHNAHDILPEIAAPTLILAGQHDSFTPMALSEKMHKLIPNSELHVVRAGTHTAPIERPAEITEAIADFLRRRVPAP